MQENYTQLVEQYGEEVAQSIFNEQKLWEDFNNRLNYLLELVPAMWGYLDGEGGGFFVPLFEKLSDKNLIPTISSLKASAYFAGIDIKEKPNKTYNKKPISQQLRTKVFERDEYRCKFCGDHKDLTVDHIFPESKGGTLDLDNLQTLCRSCNSSKGAKTNDLD